MVMDEDLYRPPQAVNPTAEPPLGRAWRRALSAAIITLGVTCLLSLPLLGLLVALNNLDHVPTRIVLQCASYSIVGMVMTWGGWRSRARNSQTRDDLLA